MIRSRDVSSAAVIMLLVVALVGQQCYRSRQVAALVARAHVTDSVIVARSAEFRQRLAAAQAARETVQVRIPARVAATDAALGRAMAAAPPDLMPLLRRVDEEFEAERRVREQQAMAYRAELAIQAERIRSLSDTLLPEVAGQRDEAVVLASGTFVPYLGMGYQLTLDVGSRRLVHGPGLQVGVRVPLIKVLGLIFK